MSKINGIRKKAFIGFVVFLGLMWICTFISKSVYAYRLPIVSCVVPESKSLEHSVKADGVVVEGGSRAVTSLDGMRVETIFVNVGDVVSSGDVLFTIDLSDIEKNIKEQQNEAEKLQMRIDTLAKNQEIRNQRKLLEQARAMEDYESARWKEEQGNRRAQAQYNSAGSALKSYKDDTPASAMNGSQKASLESSVQSAEFDREEAAKTGEENVRAAARSVQDSLLPEEVDSTLDVYRLELREIQERIRVYHGIQDSGGVVMAEADGMITDIFITVGARVPDTAVMLMTDEGKSCRFKAVIEKDQIRYFRIGGAVSLDLSGIGKVDAVIESLMESKVQPGMYEVILSLPESAGMPGMTGTLTCTQSGERERCCIPVEALYEENGRYYIYVMEEREGIMGQEYFVRRVNVGLRDKNDKWAALEEGAVSADQMIITSATREFRQGDTVRYVQAL